MTDQPLATQLADVIAEAAATHVGARRTRPLWQAAAALAWLDEHHYLTVDPIVARHVTGYLAVEWPEGGRTTRIARELLDDIVCQLNQLNTLRLLLGLRPDDLLCGAQGRVLDQEHPITCLLPAQHVAEGRWHQGLGGTWSL